MKYQFSFIQQIISGVISFLTAVIVTQIFDHEIKWALAIAVGIGTFLTSGFYRKN